MRGEVAVVLDIHPGLALAIVALVAWYVAAAFRVRR